MDTGVYTKQNIENIIPLTPVQKGMLFHYLNDRNDLLYFEQLTIDLVGDVDVRIFKKCWEVITNAHPALRSCFRWENISIPVQILLKKYRLDIEIWDANDFSATPDQDAVLDIIQKDRQVNFNLQEVPFRIKLLKISKANSKMIISNHHILFDGWSTGILLRDFFSLYTGFAGNKNVQYPVNDNYGKCLSEINKKSDENSQYWIQALCDFQLPPQLRIYNTLNHENDNDDTASFEKFVLKIDAEKTGKLNLFASQNNLTVSVLIYSAWCLILQKYIDADDVVFGITSSGRSLNVPGIEAIVGLLINTIPFVITLNREEETLLELNYRVRDKLRELIAHEHISLSEIKKICGLNKSREIFDTLVVIDNYPLDSVLTKENNILFFSGYSQFEKNNYNLTVGVTIHDGIEIHFLYNQKRYNENAVMQLACHFCNILDIHLDRAGIPVKNIDITGSRCEAVKIDYMETGTIPQIFVGQAHKYPEKTAVVYCADKLTYRQLDELSDTLSALLRKKTTKNEEIIAVIMERSLEMIIGILSILKAGAAFMPVGEDYPNERIEFMLKETGAAIILTHDSLIEKCRSLNFNGEILNLNDKNYFAGYAPGELAEIKDNALASVLYTSGSTGNPKGVLIEHRNLVNVCRWYIDKYNINRETNILQMSDYTFDPCYEDIFGALFSGATLFVIPRDTLLNMDELYEFIKCNEIHILNFLPALYGELLCSRSRLDSVRAVIAGGERLDETLKNRILDKGYKLFNHYGLIETTIDSTSFECTPYRVSIGKPIANSRCFILDRYRNRMPAGVAGEIYIGGAGVARGYLKRDELTDRRFVQALHLTNGLLFRTGDSGFLSGDGNIYLLGRKDHMVKIRGYRVELEEIEHHMSSFPGIQKCAVIVVEHNNHNRLCAYFTADTVIPHSGLKEHLCKYMPVYMVPRFFIQLDSFPLTANRKIDRKALPLPQAGSDAMHCAPNTGLEIKMAEIWSEVLKVDKDKIGILDNFFDLGGDSILSIQVVSKVKQYGINIVPGDLFEYQTIRELCKAASLTQPEKNEEYEEITGIIPLLPMQSWFFDQGFADFNHWNQSVFINFYPDFDLEIFEESLRILVKSSDGFRLRFFRECTEWAQYIKDEDSALRIFRFNLSARNENNGKTELYAHIADVQRRLDIANGPLFVCASFASGDTGAPLVFLVMHHLVADGYSWRIILSRLSEIYDRLKKHELPGRFRKNNSYYYWCKYVNAYANDNRLKDVVDFWENYLPAQKEPFPVDFPDAMNTERTAEYITAYLGEEDTAFLLSGYSRLQKTSVQEIILSAAALTFSDRSGSVLIDLEGHGRETENTAYDLSDTIGWFTSIFPFYADISSLQGNPAQITRKIKESLRNIPHKGFSYSVLRYLGGNKLLGDKPQAEIAFNYLGQFDYVNNPGSLYNSIEENFIYNRSPDAIRSHLIDIDCLIVNSRLKIVWKYSAELFKISTVKEFSMRMIANLKKILDCLKSNESAFYAVSDFPLCILSRDDLDILAGKFHDIEDIYDLTPVQQSMIFHHLYSPDSGVTIEQTVFKVANGLDPELYRKAWQKLLETHTALRVSFYWNDRAEMVQIVHSSLQIPFFIVDLQDLPGESRQQKIAELIQADRARGFDLSRAPLMRITVIRCDGNQYCVIWSYHHILLDGWSVGLLVKELAYYYEKSGDPHNVKLLQEVPLRKYICWLREQNREDAREFWERLLKDLNPSNSFLNFQNTNSAGNQQNNFATVKHILRKDMCDRLSSAAKANRLTINTVVQGAWAILLAFISGGKDVTFGVTSSGRSPEVGEISGMLGCFMNTLPMRLAIDPARPVNDWLAQIQKLHLEMRRYEYIPLLTIRQWAGISRNSGLYDLYDTILIFENYPFDYTLKNNFNQLPVELVSIEEQLDYPVTLYCNLYPDLSFNLLYDKRFIDETNAGNLLAYLNTILCGIIRKMNHPLDAIFVLLEDEIKSLICKHNDASCPFPAGTLFENFFEESAAMHGYLTALNVMNREISYAALDRKANALACSLVSSGVGPDDIIPVFTYFSIETVAGMLAVLKAGAAFVPVDPDSPDDRIKYILNDCKPRCVLVQKAKDKLQLKDIQWLDLNLETAGETETAPPKRHKNFNLAYVIYTSGTTGNPKGVMVQHNNICNQFHALLNQFPFGNINHILLAPFTFDPSIQQIFLPLATGGKLFIADNSIKTDAHKLALYIFRNKINVINTVPSYMSVILDELVRYHDLEIKYVIMAGEVFTHKLYTRIRNIIKSCSLYNIYGPTEATINTTIYKCGAEEKNGRIPIGKPFANYKIYILNKDKKLLPPGMAGELYIGGAGVARGYLNNASLTNEKFITSPLDTNDRLYSTGDLAYLDSDENFQYLGRIDTQIKINGMRVETEEIERQLLLLSEIKSTAVLARKKGDFDTQLIAFIVTENKINPGMIKDLLRRKLPDYMIPALVIPVNAIPLNRNGKTDRNELLKKIQVRENDYSRELSETEKKLQRIWSKDLKLDENPAPDQNFFELGGNSLSAIKLASLIHKEFQVRLQLSKIFDYPTIESLSRIIHDEEKQAYQEIVPAAENTHYPVSSAQKRMFVLGKIFEESNNYNISAAYRITGTLDKTRLEKAVTALVCRHEALRTSFHYMNREVVQIVHKEIDFKIQYIDSTEEIPAGELTRYSKAFDFSRAPLFRVLLFEFSSFRYTLLLDFHHIIADGISLGILLNDFINLYEGKKLVPLKYQYRDFSEWQNNLLKTTRLNNQEKYWLDKFSREIPILNLSPFSRRYERTMKAGNIIEFMLEKDVTLKLKQLLQSNGISLFSGLLTAFFILLYKHSGQNDIIIGTPASGRNNHEWDNVVGMFVNTVAIRVALKESFTIDELLLRVQAEVLQAFDNQDYQFELLVEKLELERDFSRNPLFDVLFVFQNFNMPEFALDNLRLEFIRLKNKNVKMDLSLHSFETDDTLFFMFEYSEELYSGEFIARLMEHYVNIIEAMVSNRQLELNCLNILSRREIDRVLYEYNTTENAYPYKATFKELFELQVQKASGKYAICYANKSLTYGELNCWANSLSCRFINMNIKQGEHIALIMHPSLEMVVGLLAIVKLGAVFVPLDEYNPPERQEIIINDCGAKLVLSPPDFLKKKEFSCPVIEICPADPDPACEKNPATRIAADSAFYTIYTSGTTGRPKGVSISNKNIVNYLYWLNSVAGFSENDSTVILSSLAFDLSYTGFFSALLNGFTVHLINRRTLLSPDEILGLIRTRKITYIKLTPTLLNLIIHSPGFELENYFKSLRLIILGGEKINIKDVAGIHKKYPGIKFMNHYGPTECTIGSIYHMLDMSRLDDYEYKSVIGRPISNSNAYILDKNSNLAGENIVGEICISGHNLASGYLNAPELTNGKFITCKLPDNRESRLYRTGDQGVLDFNGNICFLGRMDSQWKIRGFRVELEEIEKILHGFHKIQDARVIPVKQEDNQIRISAFLVSESDFQYNDVFDYCREKLPDYMVPHDFIRIEKIPYTGNGKIDLSALSKLVQGHAQVVFKEEPQTENEKLLAAIWQDILSKKDIGINQNFFQLGGDSIKAIQLNGILIEHGYKLDVMELFKYPTIKQIAGKIYPYRPVQYDNTAPELFPQADQEKVHNLLKNDTEIEVVHKLSFMQQMILNQNITSYKTGRDVNIVILEFKGNFSVEHFAEAWKEIFSRHSLLRTSFQWRGFSQPIQIIYKHPSLNFQELDWIDCDPARFALKMNELIADIKKEGMAVTNHSLMRFLLIKQTHCSYQFVWVYLSSFFDGWSQNVILSELMTIYASKVSGQTLNMAGAYPFSNYLKWLTEQDPESAKNFWCHEFADLSGSKKIEKKAWKKDAEFKSATSQINVDRDISDLFIKLAGENNFTLHNLFLAIWALTVFLETKDEDVIIGMVSSGRPPELPGFNSMVGPFANILPLKMRITGEQSLNSFLAVIQEKVNYIKQYDYSSPQNIAAWTKIPYKLLQKIADERTLVYLNYPGLKNMENIIPDLCVKQREFPEQKNFSFRLYIIQDDKLEISFNYIPEITEEFPIEKRMMVINSLIKSFAAAMNAKEAVSLKSILTNAFFLND